MRKRIVGLLAMLGIITCTATISLAFKADKDRETTPKHAAASKSDSLSKAWLGEAMDLYNTLDLSAKGLPRQVYAKAMHGYHAIFQEGKLAKNILAIADMSQASNRRRLYIIDIAAQQLLVHTLVAHGKNSGDVLATRFSNNNGSLQTSLGFYVAGSTYQGSNGYSMRLKGLEKGFNDQAENRAIVMHGAAYVSEQAARAGRIGRSWGCPAVSQQENQLIIDLLKDGSCLFIYAPEKKYLAASQLANSQSLASLMD